MINSREGIDVSNLCSRKLYELLKNRQWNNSGERIAIKRELLQRRHYLNEIAKIEQPRPTRH